LRSVQLEPDQAAVRVIIEPERVRATRLSDEPAPIVVEIRDRGGFAIAADGRPLRA